MAIDQILQIEETLRQLIIKVSRNKNVNLKPTSTFSELGVDSLGIVRILVLLEDIYNIDLVDSEMESIKNLDQFVVYINNKINKRKSNT